MKQIIIYTAGIFGKTGLCTWVRNFVMAMHNDYSIVLLATTYDEGLKSDLEEWVDCITYDSEKTYFCDFYLHNYQDNTLKGNIVAKRTYVMLHCDYVSLLHTDDFDKNLDYIAVSEDAAKKMRETYGIRCMSIEPFLTDYKPKKVYKFVSATRVHRTKGWDRMMEFCRLLTEKGIRFQWLLFTDGKTKPMPYIGFINMGAQPNDVVLDYMADADYTVQLSDNEGYCYSVHESLSVGTPVLVSDIPIFDCIDESRGYKLPLDMKGIDLDKILSCIPKASGCSASTNDLKEKWRKVFNV